MSGLLLTVVIVAAVVVLAIVAAGSLRLRRRTALKAQFGSEYDRAIEENDGRRAGERDLKERTKRYDQLDLRPLSTAAVERFRDEWRVVQQHFVDAPAESVAMGHSVLTAAMAEVGYPTDDQDERMSLLSVENADLVDRYRAGVRTEQKWRENGSSDTEELRKAMQEYRSVFDRVVGEASVESESAEVR